MKPQRDITRIRVAAFTLAIGRFATSDLQVTTEIAGDLAAWLQAGPQSWELRLEAVKLVLARFPSFSLTAATATAERVTAWLESGMLPSGDVADLL